MGLLAQVLVAKYSDHLPLYRQERIFGRAGVELPRSTLAQWVGSLQNLNRRALCHQGTCASRCDDHSHTMLADTVKMIAYRSETAMVALLKRHLNKEEEAPVHWCVNCLSEIVH